MVAATVYSVARYVREHVTGGDAWKTQKLMYYVQAWSLVWRNRPAFAEPIEAWKDGPVCPALRRAMQFTPTQVSNAPALSMEDQAHIDRVLAAYGGMSSDALVEQSHRERPWRDARGNVASDARTNVVITHESMAAYFGALQAEASEDANEKGGWSGTSDQLDAFIDALD